MKDKSDYAGILIRHIVKLECDMDIVEQMRSLESDHEPDGWPAVQMKQVSALCDEIDRLRAKLKAAQEQEPVGVVEKYPSVQMWVKFNESVDYGESLINGTKLYAKPVIYTKESINMPLNPTKDILVEMHRAINPRHSVIGQMHHVYRAALNAHQGFDIFDRDAPVPAQQSPAVAVPDYKEELFQLRQKAENWSTKLGFITSAINSRKISLSDKEREFPHLLIERLHTDSELLKHRSESPRITEQDAREIAMSAWRYWMNGCGRTIDTWLEEEWPNALNKLNGDKK